MAYDDDSFFRPQRSRAEVVAEGLARLGVTPDTLPTHIAPQDSGDALLREHIYLCGCRLTSIGHDTGKEDWRGRHDLAIHQCIEHPRLEVIIRIYADTVSRTWTVDGDPMPSLEAAAKALEQREAASGIYPRPRFTVGDAEGNADAG